MQSLHYNSNQPDKFSSLAEESWKYFSQFLSRYQWAVDEPCNSPRKHEIKHAILNRGNKGCCTFLRPDGYKYILPLLHPRFFEQAINRHRKVYYVSYGRQALLYFDIDLHNDWQKLSDGQEAKQKLDSLLTRFFGGSVLFWCPSSRGFNGYLKVNLHGMDFHIANQVFDRLEDALERFLAFCDNMADFEIKGKIGFLQDDGQYHWAPYGKLPIHHPDWDFARLDQFKNTPVVTIHRVISLFSMIEAQVPLEVLERHKQTKKSKGDSPIRQKDFFLVTPAIEKALVEKHGEDWQYLFSLLTRDEEGTWLHENYYRPGKAPLTELEWRKKQKAKQHEDNHKDHTGQTRGREGIPTMDGTNKKGSEVGTSLALATMVADQSFSDKGHKTKTFRIDSRPFTSKVQQRSCLGIAEVGTGDQPNFGGNPHTAGADPKRINQCLHFAGIYLNDLLSEPDSFKRQAEALRRLARYLKRTPTQEEAMDFLKVKKLFSGNWEDNFPRRFTRVKDILRFISLTFDPGKCTKGSVNLGKYDTWVKRTFPHGLNGELRGGLNEYMEKYSGAEVNVSPAFIAVFMSVVEFALLIDHNQDKSFPHRRGEEIWTALYTVGLVSVKFDSRKWAVCRDQLEMFGIIQIIDRKYCSGQAMKWSVGSYFPFLGLWRKPKGPSLKVLSIRRKRTTEQHNTLLHLQSIPRSIYGSFGHSRSPPSVINSS